ncbi:hypothetical protein LIER_00755 [Lithospermum erythrorhizon]|uniref:Uncharacterized protein n=1 Tax=Lithospermum erythrorhizon TaxID=34254 RepID=A0AAV3NKY9_LITER
MEPEEDERREAAIASSQSLRPDYKPEKPTSITQTQLSKFQELHRRRLQLKSKSTIKKKTKGRYEGTIKSQRNNSNAEECEVDKLIGTSAEQPPPMYGENSSNCSNNEGESVVAFSVSKTRQKLHWGLDTKERWERKSNM